MTKFLLYVEGNQGLVTLTELMKYTSSIAVVVPEGFDNHKIEQVCKQNGLSVTTRHRKTPIEITPGQYQCLVSSQFQFKILPVEYDKVELALNIHASVLPTYKGKHSDVWALINDEKRLGITVHRLNENFDDGEVLHIEDVLINDGMSNRQVYQAVTDALPCLIERIADGSIDKNPPKELGPDIFWRIRSLSDSRICWQQSARKVFLFVRALGRDPIYAFGDYKGIRYYIKDSSYTDITSEVIPGGVVELDSQLYIACGDSKLLHITDYESEQGQLEAGMCLQ